MTECFPSAKICLQAYLYAKIFRNKSLICETLIFLTHPIFPFTRVDSLVCGEKSPLGSLRRYGQSMTSPLYWLYICLRVNFQVLLKNTSHKIKCRSRHLLHLLISHIFKKLQLKNTIPFANIWLWKIEGVLKFKGTVFLLRDVSWETCMRIKKQHLELDMGQLTSSKLGNEYKKAIYCHLA